MDETHKEQPVAGGFWGSIDAWMAENPWHPRITPYLVYLALLFGVESARELQPAAYPLLAALQIAVVGYLLWRYRRLLPELTLKFHWLAVPTGLGLCAVWVGLGWLMVWLAPGWFGAGDEPHYLQQMQNEQPTLFHASMAVRFAGMVMLVPMFEELLMRSACLRGLHSPRKTAIGIVQFLEDLPLIGDWVLRSRLSRHTAGQPAMFTQQLNEWPVGALTTFGVAASTFVFMLAHVPRDWLGCIACGIVWCALLWYTNRGSRRLGLGPIIWSHAITNAALWAWCWSTGDWQFM